MNLFNTFKNKTFLIMFAIFVSIYVIISIIFSQYSDIWWDSASYIGIGKYIFSNGSQGVFEPQKQIFLPIILGLFWKLNLDVVFFGKLLIFSLSIVSLLFLYLISREFFNTKTAVISCIVLFFNALFFIFIFRIYTEILSICFILGSVFFILKFSKNNKYYFLFLSALFCVFAFLTKYPNILIFVILNLFLIFEILKTLRKKENNNIKERIIIFILFNVFFIVLILPFFIINYLVFNDPLYLFDLSKIYFKENLGTLYNLKAFPGIPGIFFENTDLIYFKTILYLFNILIPFMFLGIYKIFKQKNKKSQKILLLFFPALLFFLFFEIFYLKSERYIMQAFPFLAILSAYGLLKFKRKIIFPVLFIYILVSFVFIAILFSASLGEKSYGDFFSKPQINIYCENAATSDPRSVLNPNNKKIVFPYEVFTQVWETKHILKENPDCIFYFSCYENRQEHLKILADLGYKSEYSRDTVRCLYSILKKE